MLFVTIAKMIENEIVHVYKNSRHYDLGNDTLLNLRKKIINKELLAHQAEILADIISFNEALREALHDMYDRAHRIWDKMIDTINEGDGRIRYKVMIGKIYGMHFVMKS